VGYSKADLELLVGLAKDPNFDRMVNDLPRDVKKKFRGAYDDIDTQGKRTFGNIAGYAKSALAMAGVGSLVAAVGSRIQPVADLNHGLAILGRTAQLSASQQESLRDALGNVADETGISKEEQLAGLQILQDRYAVVNKLAGEGTLEKQLELTSKLANAFNLETAAASNLVGALNKQDITGKELTQTLAFLEQASAMGSLGFKELGDVMPELLGAAGAFGMSGTGAVQDVAAMVEGVTGVIQDAERARTYVRGTISRLGAADVGEKLYEQLGVKTKDSEGNFRDLSDVIEEIIESLKKLSEGERAGALKDIFGSEEAVQTMNALMQGETAFKGILEIEASGRDFAQFLEEQSDDTASGLKRLKETLKETVDDLLESTGSMDAIAEGLDNLSISVKATGGLMNETVDWWSETLGFGKDERSDRDLAGDSQAQRAARFSDTEETAHRAVAAIKMSKKGGAVSPEMQAYVDWYAETYGYEKGTPEAMKAARKSVGGGKGIRMEAEYGQYLNDMFAKIDAVTISVQRAEEAARAAHPNAVPGGKEDKKSDADALRQAVKEGVKEGMAEQKPPKVDVHVESAGGGAETPAAGEAA